MTGTGSEYIIAFISLLLIIVAIVTIYYLLKAKTSYVSQYKS